ncbi:MAG: anthranilate synthase component I family protein [Opitutales bacterium]|nr:anthranilate synthase component I family protein [Opitutales bacterium]
METFSLAQWQEWAASYQRLPVHIVVSAPPLPPGENLSLPTNPDLLFLDSTRNGRYSTLVLDGLHRLQGEPDQLTIETLAQTNPQPAACLPGHPLQQLRAWLQQNRGPVLPENLPPGNGGLFGLLCYDLVRVLEKLPEKNKPDPLFPLFTLLEARNLLVYDHAEGSLHSFHWTPTPPEKTRLPELFAQARQEARNNLQLWPQLAPTPPVLEPSPAKPSPGEQTVFSFSQDKFEAAVRQVQEYIAAGDTYQVNLSLRREEPLRTTPEEIYRHLRNINPSPYMGFFRQPKWTLLCGSPELLVKRRDSHLETRPIAGTRPRGRKNREEDQHLGAELIAHPKEKAEHLMLVDLLRNDLGRVCRYGTVEVPEFMTLERYSHVQHIVSLVTGEIHPQCDSFDALSAIFPGGTITGAPKVRTMQIIEELEPVRRGPYTGSLGWIHTSGRDMEWNIIIRTLWSSDHKIHMQSGAGIVADSDPTKEYQESLQKAKAAWAAVKDATDPLKLAPHQRNSHHSVTL